MLLHSLKPPPSHQASLGQSTQTTSATASTTNIPSSLGSSPPPLSPSSSSLLSTHTAEATHHHPPCRPSSTTRCRRLCGVSADPTLFSTWIGACSWRKRQQWMGHVALWDGHGIVNMRRESVCDRALVCRILLTIPQHPMPCRRLPGGKQSRRPGLAAKIKINRTNPTNNNLQASARNVAVSSHPSSTPSRPSAPTKSSHRKFSPTPKVWPSSQSSKLVSSVADVSEAVW